MSIFGTLERSTSSHIFTIRGSRPICSFLFPFCHSPDTSNPPRRTAPSARYITSRAPQPPSMDNFFISALIQAGFCKRHAPRYKNNPFWESRCVSTHHRARRKGRSAHYGEQSSRNIHDSSFQKRRSSPVKEAMREDYMKLVDYYYELPYLRGNELSTVTSELPLLRPLYIEQKEFQDSEQGENADLGSDSEETIHQDEAWQPRSETEKEAIDRFINALQSEATSLDILWKYYTNLPKPGVAYISLHNIEHLLRRFAVVEKYTETAMLRYLTLVEDMKDAEIALTVCQWTSAVNLAGRCFRRFSSLEVEAALRLWKEMEHSAGIKSTSVTFNILFDISVKAGKFVLAEMILKEMESRGLEYNRWTHTALIYYHGLKGDGDRVRRAYQELVQDGQIIDTLVLNCVMSAFIHAGEPSAAEQVYERMKSLYARTSGEKLPALDWKGSRDLGKMLDRAARKFKNKPKERAALQAQQNLCPNARTYRILLSYHTTSSGEMDRVTALLDDMQFLGIPLQGEIFMELFKGFAIHGGVRYSAWTRTRLEGVWISLLRALEAKTDGIRIGKDMAVWSLKGFYRCADGERAMAIWREVKEKNLWQGNQSQEAKVERILWNLVEGEGNE
ncbi:MAG: hypothetical protein M1834_004573 [Cirrosporium novae-zelandiae]|nr:MAG: hypothetical protein M1834_004573 [Cirrosporium novae-zelandiae]